MHHWNANASCLLIESVTMQFFMWNVRVNVIDTWSELTQKITEYKFA